MKLLLFLLRTSPSAVVLATCIGVLSGACNAGIIAVINTALNNARTSMAVLVTAFAGLGIAKITTAAISQLLLSRFAQKSMSELRQDLCRKILIAPLRHLEEIGAHRLLASLTEDVLAITMALRGIPSFVIDIAIVVGCLAYLAWLSWTAFLIMLGVIIPGILCHQGLYAGAYRCLRLAREDQDTLFRHYRALTEGIKELRIHRNRREAFLSQNIQPTAESFQRHSVAVMARFIIGASWTQLLFYILIGFVLLALPSLKDISTKTMTGYVLIILYLMGPLRQLMNILPGFSRANVALQKIEQLGLSLEDRPTDGESVIPSTAVLTWKRLELRDVVFAYHREGGDGNFILGPISLTLHPGEVVFVVGGNGSGKSTLVKLLTGLYPLEAGEIRMDGQPITDQNREWYRQHFSVLFSDFYLFENLLGLDSTHLDLRAREYLVQLQLDHKVQVEDGRLSTTALSQGQRKRLALLTAYLENRPIYVFDEWAADQDPQFKEFFYTQLLPELKSRGKTALVITHDDRYFHVAERVIKLDYGKQVDFGMLPTV
jgi:putative ATP-binding cassette transporter